MIKLAFLSPHPDDIAFSIGFILTKMKAEKNLFTFFGLSNYTAFGYGNTLSVSRKRYSEDLIFSEKIDSNLFYFYYPDFCLFKKRVLLSKNMHINDFREHILRNDINFISRKFDYVFVPYSVGNHIDHILINRVSRKLIAKDKIIFYLDLPYAFSNRDNLKGKLFEFYINWKEKENLIKIYKTQVNNISIKNFENYHKRNGEKIICFSKKTISKLKINHLVRNVSL